MGSVFEFVVSAPPSAALDGAMDRAFDEVARLETALSEWRPESEISQVNAAAGRQAVRVGPDVLAVVQEALRVGAESQGAFDVTWAALRGVWDFRAVPPKVPDRATLSKRLALIDYRKVVVDSVASTVRLTEPGMAIGLGGIAKGYALDRSAAILEAAGFHDFELFGGGQVLVSGRRGGVAWRIGIRDPRGEGFFAFYDATHGSASTSGDYEHFFVVDGVRYHHIIDTRPSSPGRGMPARGLVSATVLAETGIRADALATATFVLGPQRGIAFARRLGVEAILVDEHLQVLATDGIRHSVRMRPIGAK
jgi:thiamine biosynthesis lipoprotein